MDKCFNNSICNILENAEKEMLECHHPYVGTEHLLLSLLKINNIKNMCYKYNLTYQSFKKELLKIIGSATKKSEAILYTPLLKLVIDKAYNKAFSDHKDMDEYYLLSSLLDEQDGIALRIACNMGVDIESLVKELNKPSLLYELGINLNEKEYEEIYLRDKEIDEIMEILLRKNKNNPLLVGHAGVGKTAIVEELANRIKNGCVPDKLKNYYIFQINTSTLIAGTKYRGEFESRVNNLIKEVMKYQNIILFIDEIHTIVKTGASDGSIDAANILKPYLARGDIKVIGATTIEEYNEYIKKDSALLRRFTKVTINEPNGKDMKYILDKIKPNFEKYYNVVIDNKALKYLIKNVNKYFPNLYNPDKSIEILDTACARKIMRKSDSKVTEKDLEKVILNRINMLDMNNQKLDKVFNELIEKYHEKSIKSIINLIKDKSLNKYIILNGHNDNKIKIINYIANSINANLINIDCKEYNDEYSIAKLFNNNYLYNKLLENPYSYIIINNYNDRNIILHNLVNSMIKNGYITNSSNEKLYLNNAIIFILNNEEVSTLGFHNNLLFTN